MFLKEEATVLLNNVIEGSTKDDILPVIDTITRNNSMNRLLTLVLDMLMPSFLYIATSQKDTETQQHISNLFTRNTDITVHRFSSFFPNAFTLVNAPNIFNKLPQFTAGLSAMNVYSFYVFASIWLKNMIKNNDIKITIKDIQRQKKLNLNIDYLGVFYSDAIINRARCTQRELDAILLHEIGHNIIGIENTKKYIISGSLIALSSFFYNQISTAKKSIPNTGSFSKSNIVTDTLNVIKNKTLFSTTMINGLYLIMFLIFIFFILQIKRGRILEYKSDKFATMMGYGEDLKSILIKLENLMLNGTKIDTQMEDAISNIVRVQYKIMRWLNKYFRILTHPHIDHRIQNIDDVQAQMRKQESILMESSIIENVVEKICNILEAQLLKIKNISSEN